MFGQSLLFDISAYKVQTVTTAENPSFLNLSHEIYIVSTMNCLSIVYPNPNPNLI